MHNHPTVFNTSGTFNLRLSPCREQKHWWKTKRVCWIVSNSPFSCFGEISIFMTAKTRRLPFSFIPSKKASGLMKKLFRNGINLSRNAVERSFHENKGSNLTEGALTDVYPRKWMKRGNIPAMRNLPGGLLTWNTNNVASSKLSLKIYFVARHQRLPKVTKLSWEYQAFWDNGTGAKWMAYQRWQKLIKFTHKVAMAARAMQMWLWNFPKPTSDRFTVARSSVVNEFHKLHMILRQL